jgi:predicted dehydrogenase
MSEERQLPDARATRRTFLTTTGVAAGAAFAANLGLLSNVHAAGSDEIRVGLIGCGGRGTGAAGDCLQSSKGVRLVAMCDVFKDRLQGSRAQLIKDFGKKVDVPDERCFTDLDGYKKLLKCDVNLVIQATPPGFRHVHLPAIIEAGKNLFTEKPVGVDGPSIRAVLKAAEAAQKKNLAVVSGTQRRHQRSYLEIMKRIKAGDIGDITAARCYWNQGKLWNTPKKKGWSDLEWQIRNWLYFTWLSGDHIVEQHVHNLDVINWALGGPPARAVGMGGRQVRTDKNKFGHIYDHFAIDYEYPNGVHLESQCRQIEGCENNVSEVLVGTKGTSITNDGRRSYAIKGKKPYRFPRDGDNKPYVQEHTDLIASIRAGKPLNELKRVAESTLTAIMGRMSAYTGKAITFKEALASTDQLMPKDLNWKESYPIPPVAMPGDQDQG